MFPEGLIIAAANITPKMTTLSIFFPRKVGTKFFGFLDFLQGSYREIVYPLYDPLNDTCMISMKS